AALGRVVSHPGSISVMANRGTVTVAGPILEREAESLLDTVKQVRGVTDVVDHLERHRTGEGVPGLQGGRRREQLFELRQRNWTPAVRLLAGLTGGSVVIWSRGVPGPLRPVFS